MGLPKFTETDLNPSLKLVLGLEPPKIHASVRRDGFTTKIEVLLGKANDGMDRHCPKLSISHVFILYLWST